MLPLQMVNCLTCVPLCRVSKVVSIFRSARKYKISHLGGFTNLYSCQQCVGIALAPHPHQDSVLSGLFMAVKYLIGVSQINNKVYFSVNICMIEWMDA